MMTILMLPQGTKKHCTHISIGLLVQASGHTLQSHGWCFQLEHETCSSCYPDTPAQTNRKSKYYVYSVTKYNQATKTNNLDLMARHIHLGHVSLAVDAQ